jgi:uncharacterized protein (DUF488 family)
MIQRLFTIGAYGFTGRTFVDRLSAAGVDLFIDIRARRGMRGAEYAFANAARLEAALERAGIGYAHAKVVAPSKEVRDVQYSADAAAGIAKRERSSLGAGFIKAYRSQVLAGFDARRFVEAYCDGAKRPVLFCVEREPGACHRSLLAERISADLGVVVENLMP